MRRLLPVCLMFVLSLQYCIAQPNIVKNANPALDPQGGFFFTQNVVNLNGKIYFGATDGVHGYELWTSDGNGSGTHMVIDLPGDPGINTVYSVNGSLYFLATTAANGRELWKSDGSSAGTHLVKDIWPGSSNGQTNQIVNIGSTLYFNANNSINGIELWKSDGTDAGTVMIKDINPSGDALGSTPMLAIGNVIYFIANDGTNKGFELFSSDGTSANTNLVKDVNPAVGVTGVIGGFANFNGKLMFLGNDGVNGLEPWISDGTSVGTVMIKNIDNTASNSMVGANIAVMGGYAYFNAQDAATGGELWKTDGTASGTTLVKDILPGPGNGSPQNMVNINGTLYFSAVTTGIGRELWKTDGSDVNTVLVKDINGGAANSNPVTFTHFNGNGLIYFWALGTGTGLELWQTDGSAAGTSIVYDVNKGTPGSGVSTLRLTVLGSAIFFIANDGINGAELWSYQPTTPLTIPPTISDLSVVPVSSNAVKLNWSDPDGEATYEIEYSDGNNVNYYTIDIIGGDMVTFTTNPILVPLTEGVPWYFRIRSKNASGYSAYSNEVVFPIPSVFLVTSITVTGTNNSTSIIENDGTLQMTATVLPANATNSAVTWSVAEGNDIATISSSGLLTATDNGAVTVKASATDGSNVSGTLQINISGQQEPCVSPAKPEISADLKNPTAIVLTSSSATGNQWYLDNEPIENETNKTFTASEDGVYKVQVTMGTCQSPFSDAFIVFITGVIDTTHSPDIHIYPNPVTDFIIIKGVSKEANGTVISQWGVQQMIKQEMSGDQLEIHTNDLSPGSYVLQVTEGQQTYTIRFIKY